MESETANLKSLLIECFGKKTIKNIHIEIVTPHARFLMGIFILTAFKPSESDSAVDTAIYTGCNIINCQSLVGRLVRPSPE